MNFNCELPNSCINDELEKVLCQIHIPSSDYEQEALQTQPVEKDSEEKKEGTGEKFGIQKKFGHKGV